ncbi:MAG: DNA repair ATPase, partial [Acidimicrobiales bacterium]|nr:DNA repair ATPase [Acidimicrobiales bacterium]
MAEEQNTSTYALLRGRLEQAAQELTRRANSLNQRRLDTFGSSAMKLLGTERVRTEANAVPRDVVAIGDQMILGYNVAAGLKSEVRSEDVFAVHHYTSDPTDSLAPIVLSPNPEGLAGTALDDDQFHRDFDELHTYFKDTQLQQLYRRADRLLAIFRTGSGIGDVRVLRWQIEVDGRLRYLDARGDRDHRFPPHQDVEWTLATRADHVGATHIAITDRVLVNPLGGSLEILLDDGGGGTRLLTDPLQHADQSLQDCQISSAVAGDLVLLDVLPYGEMAHRYYVVNLLTHTAERIDDLGQTFRQLPDGQGIIFPSGVYMKTGEIRTFDLEAEDMELLEVVRSPNGEDVVYVFHERASGVSVLLPYNVVRQEVTAPISCHGHTFFPDGTMVVFREDAEPSRIHPIQVWATPFSSDEWYEAQPRQTSELDRIGNAALVRGIADALALTRLMEGVEPSTAVYADLVASAGRFLDGHHWSADPEVNDLAEPARNIRVVAEQVIDEFERMLAVQNAASDALSEAESSLGKTLEDLRLSPPRTTEAFIDGLASVRTEIGHLHTLRDRREIDVARVDELIESTDQAYDSLAQTAAAHLASEGAFGPYHDRLSSLSEQTTTIDSSLAANELLDAVDAVAASMDVVAGTVSDLVVDDPRVRTSVLEQVSGVLAELNRVRAGANRRRTELIESETGAAFATELGLFGQSIATAVGRADTPEACDEALARLLLQLEQLETTGPRTDAQLEEINSRREQVTEALGGKRQQLVDDRQQRAERLISAATRTLDRVTQRAEKLGSVDEINGFFAADAMVSRIRALVEDLRELGEPVRADELASQLGAARDGAARSLRDRQDLYDGEAVKLGRHRFSVDDRTRELTIVPTGEELEAVLTGTELRLPVHSDVLDASKDLWELPFSSETRELYRSTFLAFQIIESLRDDTDRMSTMFARPGPGAKETIAQRILPLVQAEVDGRLDQGYDRGVHDVDAARIAGVVGSIVVSAGSLIAPGHIRARAQLAWADIGDETRAIWQRRGSAAGQLGLTKQAFGILADQLQTALNIEDVVANYLLGELTVEGNFAFATNPGAAGLVKSLGKNSVVASIINELADDIGGAQTVLTDYLQRTVDSADAHQVPEVVAALLTPSLPRRVV